MGKKLMEEGNSLLTCGGHLCVVHIKDLQTYLFLTDMLLHILENTDRSVEQMGQGHKGR